jgi:general secretion pathway protein D
MERSKLIISIVVGIASVLIIWRVGFVPDPPIPGQAEKPAETKVVTEAEKPPDVQKLVEANEPTVAADVNEPGRIAAVGEPITLAAVGEQRRPDGVGRPRRAVIITEPNEPAEPNEPMEIVNLKNVEMKTIIEKLAKWTGKVIIPTDESMKERITIYAPEKLPRSKALQKIYSALSMKGYIAEQTDGTIFIKPITGAARLGEVPTITDDYPLAKIENKDQIVQKFFNLKNYSPSQMGQIILPLMGEYGYVSADEGTGSLLVIDTVKSLMRISLIIEQFDVVDAEEIITEIFEIQHGNPTKIVEMLQSLLSDSSSSSSVRGPGGRGGPPFMQRPGSSSSSSRGRTSGGTATSVTLGTSRTPAILIAEPTYNWIIAKATAEDLKQIGEWIKRLDRSVPTLFIDQPLARVENKNQIVQKFFKLENYSPSQMAQIVGPLVSEETGYVSADESTGNLLVIDTVENLIRIEMIIAEFDVPEAEQTVTEIFEIRYGDPSEIVQLLRMLITGEAGTSSRSLGRSSSYGRSSYGRSSSYSRTSYSSSRGYSSGFRGSSRPGSSQSVMIGPSDQPVVLIPEPNRKWIIARASAEDMQRIGEWIDKLDKEEPVKSEHETISITYADVSEVADRLNEAMQQMPGSELQASVLIQPLENARQIVIFGRADMREMVKKLIAEIDIPTGLFQTEHFKLKYADPDDVKEKLEELYDATSSTSGRGGYTSIYYFGSARSTAMSAETVRVISYVTRKQVTVIASAENMEKVRQQIKEWDVPIPVDELKPRIIELHNSDPVQMAELLKTLFTEEGGGGMSIYDILFGSGTEDKQKIVGPLYGQLTFEEVPGTKKIIVISKIPEAYDVIEQLILDLDREEMGEIPKVIELKYADPEDLSERLNAMFVEAGQQAPIRYAEQGLSATSAMDAAEDSASGGGSSNNQSAGQSQQQTYTPPWSGSGARSSIDEELPISNVIGRIRFVPEPHTKSIMVLAPPEFMDEIEELIAQLDVPGKQVMIEAIIVEVEHTKVTSLGIELSTNPNAFGSAGENALTALANITHLGTYNSASGIISPSGAAGSTLFGATGTSGTLLGVGTDVYALLDFLIKTTDAKILNQQTIWTKDNEEASFFKGSEVPFLGSVTQSVNIGTQQAINYELVGMELRARPGITPEDKVDMEVNIEISQLTAEREQNVPIRSQMITTTNMIVQNNQTLLLGGILFQKDSKVEAKLPLFGDLPLIGGLFRHNSIIQTNSELLVFMTPHVIDEDAEELPEAVEEKKEKLENIRGQLEETMEELAWEMP